LTELGVASLWLDSLVCLFLDDTEPTSFSIFIELSCKKRNSCVNRENCEKGEK
jgi:hypothetical protein